MQMDGGMAMHTAHIESISNLTGLDWTGRYEITNAHNNRQEGFTPHIGRAIDEISNYYYY